MASRRSDAGAFWSAPLTRRVLIVSGLTGSRRHAEIVGRDRTADMRNLTGPDQLPLSHSSISRASSSSQGFFLPRPSPVCDAHQEQPHRVRAPAPLPPLSEPRFSWMPGYSDASKNVGCFRYRGCIVCIINTLKSYLRLLDNICISCHYEAWQSSENS